MYLENIDMYIYIYIYIHIIYIINKYVYYINITYFSEIYTACVCIYIYIINIHSKTFILYAINRLSL